MPTTTILIGLTVAAGLLLVLTAVAQVLIARRRRPGGAIAMFVLRLLVLGVLGALIWKVFWDREVAEEKEDDAERPERRVVLLQDASNSMAFDATGGRPRNALADDCWAEFQAAADDAEGNVVLERHFFARNLVPENQRDRLATDSTQLGAAIVTALGRLDPDSLVVVSDGAATDGPVPPYLLQWAANRRIRVYAVSIGEPRQQIDLAVGEVRCPLHNPETIAARVVVNGDVGGPVQVEFSIDHGPRRRVRLDPRTETEASVNVPELATGWHEFAVFVNSIPGEVTALNNVQRGIFHVAPPNRVLVLYDTPRLETLHLVRLARERFPERVTVVSLNDPEVATFDPQRFLLTVLADVPAAKVPDRLRAALRDGHGTVLLLYGDHFADWNTRRLSTLPILEATGAVNLAREGRDPAHLEVDPRTTGPAFEYFSVAGLSVDILGQVQLAPTAVVLVRAVSGSRRLPVLVADAAAAPRAIVMLAPASWKWSLNPDPQVRGLYRTFWSTIMAWAVGETGSQFQFELDFAAAEAGVDATDVGVRPRGGALADYRQVRLTVEAEGEPARPVEPTAAGDQWTWRFPHPPDRPAVVWFTAIGQYRGQAVRSERRPLLLPLDAGELLDTAPHPERLAALCTAHPERFAQFGSHQGVVRRVFAELQPNLKPRHRRHRQPALELTLAGIAILLLAAEWFIERMLKQNPSGARRD